GEGDADLEHVGVLQHVLRGTKEALLAGEAGGEEGHEGGALLGRGLLEGALYAPAHARSPCRRSTSATSLSPRPDRFTTSTCSGAMVGASSRACATAWALSSAGMIPSLLASRSNAASAWASVTATYSASPASR